MKALLVFLSLASATLAAEQATPVADLRNVSITADQQQTEGSLLRYRGHVRIATDTILLEADEVDFHRDTGEAEARGSVRVKFLSKSGAAVKPQPWTGGDYRREWFTNPDNMRRRFPPEIIYGRPR